MATFEGLATTVEAQVEGGDHVQVQVDVNVNAD